MASHIIGDRTSTPDSTSKSTTLRPPSTSTSTSTSTSRGLSTSHQIRASADMSSLTAPLSARTTRPRSEIFYRNTPQHLLVAASSSSTAAATATATTTAADEAAAAAADDDDRATQQWLDDIEQYQTLLEEMAAATLDHGFKGELSSIEQWFRILSEAERTAALYSLLQQTTQVQIRFFIAVLQQMARSNPVSGILLSPAGGFGESDPMSNRLNEAMSNLHIDNIDNNNNNNARNSLVNRPPLSPGAATTTTTTNTSTTTTATANNTTNNKQRNSGLDSSTINAMFPEAAAVIAKKKAEFSQQQTQTQTQQQTQAQGQMTSNSPNRNSSAFEQRNPLVTPVISTLGSKDSPMSQPPASPWRRTPDPLPLSMSLSQGQHHHQQQHQQQPPIARPKSSSSQQQQPMLNQFPQSQSHTHTSPNLRSPHDDEKIRNTTITVPDLSTETASLLSPYNIGASWASMTNTPMMSSFSQAQAQTQAQAQAQAQTQAQQVPSPGPSQADMVANATAMKLAALSTVNGRFALDDARKYRRARSNDGQGVHTHSHNHLQHNGGNNNYHHHQHHQQQHQQINNTITDPTTPLGFMQHTPQPLTPSITTPSGIPGTNVIMVNDAGQILDTQQFAALQTQHQQHAGLNFNNRRSRPTSPGIMANMHSHHPHHQHPTNNSGGITSGINNNNNNNIPPFTSPQNNGFLAAYDMNSWFGNPSLLLSPHGHSSHGHGSGEVGGYLSDHSDLNRGRSPRGRRGTSKPPEDPTDPALLRDIPSWLRSLRLHKYTENLKDLRWDELVELDDRGLEGRGVNALGARNKMLKVFEQVKEAKKEGRLDSIL